MRVKETIYSSNETTLNHMPMLASEWAHVIGKLTLKMLRVEKKEYNQGEEKVVEF